VRLAYHFGMKPWDVDRLTVAEFDLFCRAVAEIEREAAKNG
jgi:hypothetical protein